VILGPLDQACRWTHAARPNDWRIIHKRTVSSDAGSADSPPANQQAPPGMASLGRGTAAGAARDRRGRLASQPDHPGGRSDERPTGPSDDVGPGQLAAEHGAIGHAEVTTATPRRNRDEVVLNSTRRAGTGASATPHQVTTYAHTAPSQKFVSDGRGGTQRG
jgi:hypothetical protein